MEAGKSWSRRTGTVAITEAVAIEKCSHCQEFLTKGGGNDVIDTSTSLSFCLHSPAGTSHSVNPPGSQSARMLSLPRGQPPRTQSRVEEGREWIEKANG